MSSHVCTPIIDMSILSYGNKYLCIYPYYGSLNAKKSACCNQRKSMDDMAQDMLLDHTTTIHSFHSHFIRIHSSATAHKDSWGCGNFCVIRSSAFILWDSSFGSCVHGLGNVALSWWYDMWITCHHITLFKSVM